MKKATTIPMHGSMGPESRGASTHHRRILMMLIAIGIIMGLTIPMTLTTVPSVHAANTDDTASTADMVRIGNTVYNGNTVDSADNDDNAGNGNTVDSADNADNGNTVDSADNDDTVDGADNDDSAGGVDSVDNDDSVAMMGPDEADKSIKSLTKDSGGVGDIVIRDTLDGDNAYVSGLQVLDIVSGVAPWDKDNNPGNDTDAGNRIIRSFDDAVYNLQVITTSDDPMTYYRTSRVGIRITLPVDDQKAQFDVGSMGWVDRSAGYEPRTVENADGTQTLTVYRLLEPTTSNAYTVPSMSTMNIPIRIKAMLQGETIAPSFEAWMVPNTTTNRVASVKNVDELTVSSAPRFNVRIEDGQSSENREWDFDAVNPNAGIRQGSYDSDKLNSGLGKQYGQLHMLGIAVDIRNTSTAKALKGTELPDGDIEFDLVANNTLTATYASGDKKDYRISDVQPYFWCVGGWGVNDSSTWKTKRGGCQNLNRSPRVQSKWNIRTDWKFLAGTDWMHIKDDNEYNIIKYNGDYEISQSRTDDGTVFHVKIHGARVEDVNDLPHCGYSDVSCSGSTKGRYMNDNGDVMIGAISDMALMAFMPKHIGGEDPAEHYGASDVAYSIDYNVRNLRITGKSGQGGSDIISTDNSKNFGGDIYIKGTYSPSIYYACTTESMRDIVTWENPSDCATWRSSQLNNTQDTTHRDIGQYVNTGAVVSATVDPQFATALTITLSTFDDKVFHVNKGLDLYASSGWTRDASKFNGFEHTSGTWTFSSNSNGYYNDDNPVDVYYVLKADGTGWSSDAEQGDARIDSDNLRYYKDYDEAVSHGTIVGVLMAGRYPRPLAVSIDRFMNPAYKLHVNDDAETGATAAVTIQTGAYSRGFLAEAFNDTPDVYERSEANDDAWEAYTRNLDPYDLYFNRGMKPDKSADMPGSYRKATYVDGNWKASNHEGRSYGDTTVIVENTPYIGIALAQTKPNSKEKKDLYDLDRDERTVDFQVPFHITSYGFKNDSTTDAVIEVVLPKGLKYHDSSAYYDGTYKQDATNKQPGTITNGTALVPRITNKANGTQTLTFTVQNVPTDNSNHTIWLTADIGDAGDPENDVQNNEQFTTTAYFVRTTENIGPASTWNNRVKNVTMRVSKTLMSSISTKADPLINEVNDPIRFINRFGNYADSITESYGVSLMPKNGTYGSKYSGDYTMGTITLKALNGASLDNATIRMTNDRKYLDIDPKTITTNELDTWRQATIDTTTGEVAIPSDMSNATAFVIIAPMEKNNQISATFTIEPHGQNPGDIYANRFSDLNNTVQALATTAIRTVSGVAWYDTDENGARETDKQDFNLEGVHVKLINSATANNPTSIANAKPINTLTGEPASTVTNANGEYSFTALPAGEYTLVFTPNDRTSWSTLRTTILHADNVANSVNNDATGVYANAATRTGLTAGTIPVTMPELKDMSGSRYSEEFLDNGITGPMPLGDKSPVIKTKKILTGRSFLPGETFRATITPVTDNNGTDKAPENGIIGNDPDDDSIIQYTSNDSTVILGINDAVFTRPGTYQYAISEENTGTNAIKYDDTMYTVTIIVAYDETSLTRHIQARIQTTGNTTVDTITFNNKYTGKITDLPMTGTNGAIIMCTLLTLLTIAIIANRLRTR